MAWDLAEEEYNNGVCDTKFHSSTSPTGQNLKELYMDDLQYSIRDNEVEAMSALDTEDESVAIMFIFPGCNGNVWERVSMRNSRLAIPKKALMKFPRNTPTSLCWFKSNLLTAANINILYEERPEIEFVS